MDEKLRDLVYKAFQEGFECGFQEGRDDSEYPLEWGAGEYWRKSEAKAATDGISDTWRGPVVGVVLRLDTPQGGIIGTEEE